MNYKKPLLEKTIFDVEDIVNASGDELQESGRIKVATKAQFTWSDDSDILSSSARMDQ